jgi:ferric-dicitrate binding protein FerR (iron transport regulator)
MVNDRFIKLLTKELCDDITDVEREELYALLQANAEYRDQKQILKDYWEKDRVEYQGNAAMYRKVLEKIKIGEDSAAKIEEDSAIGEDGAIGEDRAAKIGEDGAIGEDRAIGEDSAAKIGEDSAAEIEEDIAGSVPRRRTARIVWYSAAAVMAGILLFTLYLNRKPVVNTPPIASIPWLQKTTLPTKKSVVTLSDGTVVTLNSATTLKYPDHFGDTCREIYLDGEAYFDVARDASHPFIIHANKMNIRVLGTSFDVKSYQNEALSEASLIRGSIEVTLNDRPSDRIILKPREKLIVQNNNTAVIKPTAVLANRVSPDSGAGKGTRYALTNLTYFPNNAKTIIETSWVENKLVVRDREFAQFSGQMERWYGVHIEFGNERVKGYRFTALFEKETLPQALNALKMIEHFNYRIADSTVYIY